MSYLDETGVLKLWGKIKDLIDSNPSSSNAWTKVGQVQGGGKDITINTTNCSEVMVVCSYSTSYIGSTVIPVETLTSSLQEVYLPGGYWGSGSGRHCYGKISKTKVVSCYLRTDSSDRSSQYTTVYVR